MFLLADGWKGKQMPRNSVYYFCCLCGREFQKERQETFRCPDCGRLLVMEWGREGSGEPTSSCTPEGKMSFLATERDESGIRSEQDEVFGFRHAQ